MARAAWIATDISGQEHQERHQHADHALQRRRRDAELNRLREALGEQHDRAQRHQQEPPVAQPTGRACACQHVLVEDPVPLSAA